MDTTETQYDGQNGSPVVVQMNQSAKENGSMGLKGLLWTNVGNMSGMALIAVAFLYLGREFISQAKEERLMYREELRSIRVEAEQRNQRTEATHTRSMEKMGNTIERSVNALEKATTTMEKAVEAMPKKNP